MGGMSEPAWQELDGIVERLDREGAAALTADELLRLPNLYRSAGSALAQARASGLDPGDRGGVDSLNALVARSYLAIHCSGRPSGEALGRFFRVRFPRTVRRHAGFVAAALLVLALGILTGWRLTLADPERFYSFVDEGMANGRTPSSSTQELRDALYTTGDPPADPGDSDEDAYGLVAFASFLFTHNAQVGLLCFALGFAAGVPVLFLLFSNGLILGAFAALYQSRGLGLELWAWLLPHGVSELAAVCLCGAAGMVVGASVVFPGPHSRLQNLAIQGRSAALLVLGAMFMMLLAGALEGIFRQSVHDPAVRLAVAAVTFLGWLLYFLLAGRHAADPRS